MSNTVVCALCRNEFNRRCVRKNNKVKINKPRHCDLYEESTDKRDLMEAKRANKPQSILRPDWYWDRKEYMKELRKEAREQVLKEMSKNSHVTVHAPAKPTVSNPNSGDPRYPLTGDLSRFISSASEE